MMLSGARHRQKPMIRRRNQGPAHQPEGESLEGKAGPVNSWKKHKQNLESDLETSKTTRSSSRSKTKWNLKECSLVLDKFERSRRTSVIDDNDRRWIIRQPCRRKPNYLIKLQPKDIMSATSAPAKLPRKQFARKSTGKLHLHPKNSCDVGEKSAKKLRLGNYAEPKKPPDKYSDGDHEIKNGNVVESTTEIKEIVLSNESIVIDDVPQLNREVSTGSAISEIAVTPKTKITPKISEHNSLTTSSPAFVPECPTPNCQKNYPDKRSQSCNEDHTQKSIKQNTECSDKIPTAKQDISNSSGSFNLSEADKVHERKSNCTSFLDSFKESFRTKKHLPHSEETKKDIVPSAELATATNAATPEEPVVVQDNKVSNNTIDKLRKGLQCGKLKSIVHKVFKDRNEVINTSDQKAAVKEETQNEITLNSGVIVKENDHQNKEKELCSLNVEQNQVDNTSTIDNSSNSIPSELSNHKTESKDLTSTGNDNLTPLGPEEDDDDEVTIICTTCTKCNKEKRNLSGGSKQFQSSPAKLVPNSFTSMQTSQVSDLNKENNSSDASSNIQEDLTPDISFKEESACDIISSDETKSAVDDSLTGKSTSALSEKVVIVGDIEKKVIETDINEQTAIAICAINSQKVDVSNALPVASVSQPEVAAVEIESNAPLVDKELIPDSFINPEVISANKFDSKNSTTLSDLEKVGKTVDRMEMNIPVDDISGALHKELLTTNQSSLSADEAVASEVAKLIKETSVHNLEQSSIIQTSVHSDSALSTDVTSSSESMIVIQSVHSVTPQLKAVGQPSQEVEKQQLSGDTLLQRQSNDIYLDVKSSNVTTEQLKLNITEISHARVDDLNVEQDVPGKSCSDIISQIDTVVNQSSNVVSAEAAPSASDYCHIDSTEQVNAAASAQEEAHQVTLEAGPSKNAEISSLSTEVPPVIESISTSDVMETKSIDSSPLMTPVAPQMELKSHPVEIISTTSEKDPIPIETGTEAFETRSESMNIDTDKTICENTEESYSLVPEAMADVLIVNNDFSSKRPGSPSFTNNQLSKRLKLDTICQDTLEEKTDSNSNTCNIPAAIMEQLPDGYTIVATKDLQSMLKKKAVDLLKPMVLQLEAVSKALETYRSMIKEKNVQHATEISKLKQDSQLQEQKPKMVSVESQHEDNFFIQAIKAQSYPVLSSFKASRWKMPSSSTPPTASDSSIAVNPSTPVTTTCPVAVDAQTKPLQTSPSPTSKPEVHKSVVSSSTKTAKSPISKLENMLSSTVSKYTSPCSFLQKLPTMKPSQVTPSPTQTTSTSPQKAGKKSSSPMAVIDLTQDSDDVTTSAKGATQQTSPKPSPGPPPKLIPNRKPVSQQLAPKVASPTVLPSLIQSPLLRANLQTSKTVNNVRMATATPSIRPNQLPQRMMHIPVNSAIGPRYIRPQQMPNSVAHQQLPEHRNTVHGSTMMTSNPVMAQATSAARALTAPSVVHQLLPQTKTASQGIPNSTHSRPPPQLMTQPQTVRGFTSQYREPVRYPGVQPTSIENRPQPPPNVSISLMQQTPMQQHRLLQSQSRAPFPPPSYTVALNSQTVNAPQLQTRTDSVMLPPAVNTVMLQRHEHMQAQVVPNNPNRYPVVMGMPTPAQQLPASQSSSSSAIHSQRHALQLHTTMVRLKETYDNLQNQQTEIVVKLQSKDISNARREELLKTLHEIQENLHSTSQKQKQFQTEFTHIHGQSFRNQPPLQPVAAPVAPTSQATATSQLLALSHQASVQQRHQQFRMKHPASLPPQPVPAQVPLQAKLLQIPGKPVLNISRAANGIVLSWTMVLKPGSADIGFYHLFAYQEQEGPPSSSNWKKIGDVKALPLPMACTLTQFQHGSIYHFSVCAVDVFGRSGDFSENSSINLIN